MGFLSKLFSHKSVEEVADEIANTYAKEVQAVTAEQTDTAGAETEQVNMLEVSDTGEIEYTERQKPSRENHHRRRIYRPPIRAKSAGISSHSG